MLKKMSCAIFVVILALCAVGVINGIPLHASCKVEWDWPNTQCSAVQARLVAQIAKWTGSDCGTGQKCRYTLKSKTPKEVKSTHETPVKHYVDDQTFTFNETGGGTGCHVDGYSTSETWYAVLDYGTNYCNLENLISGAGLDKVTGYSETTSNSVCTQYSSANCEKY